MSRSRTSTLHLRALAVLVVLAALGLAATPAPAQESAPQTNTTYQPTNEEWLVRGNEGQEPIRTVVGGPSNPTGSLQRTPDGDVAVRQVITFDASASAARRNDRYGGTEIVSWVWDFGDGTQANAPVVQHAYDRAGVYHVQLIVHDDTGWRSTRTTTVVVGDAPCGQEPQEIWIPTADGLLRMRGFLTVPAGDGPHPVILEFGPYGPFPRGACDDAVRTATRSPTSPPPAGTGPPASGTCSALRPRPAATTRWSGWPPSRGPTAASACGGCRALRSGRC